MITLKVPCHGNSAFRQTEVPTVKNSGFTSSNSTSNPLLDLLSANFQAERSKLLVEAKLAIIGGSEAYRLNRDNFGEEIAAKVISTPFGRSAPLHLHRLTDDLTFGFLSRHGEDGYSLTPSFVNYRANIWALKELGVERIISWSGPGAISDQYHPGDLVLPSDIIDFTKRRPSTFFEGQGLGFIRQYPVFCPQLKLAIATALTDNNISFHRDGVYICTEGPRLETPAEIKCFRLIGADMVGMTLAPEVFLARELEMCYAPICYITNYAEGIKPLEYRSGVLFEGTLPEEKKSAVEKSLASLIKILPQALLHLHSKERNCPCPDAMLRYKKRGDIGPDWRAWLRPNK